MSPSNPPSHNRAEPQQEKAPVLFYFLSDTLSSAIPASGLPKEVLFPMLFDPEVSNGATPFEEDPYNCQNPLGQYQRYLMNPHIPDNERKNHYRLINAEIGKRIIEARTGTTPEKQSTLSTYAFLACVINSPLILQEAAKLKLFQPDITATIEELFSAAFEVTYRNIHNSYKSDRRHSISTHIRNYLYKQLPKVIYQQYFPELKETNMMAVLNGIGKAHREKPATIIGDLEFYEWCAAYAVCGTYERNLEMLKARMPNKDFSTETLLNIFRRSPTLESFQSSIDINYAVKINRSDYYKTLVKLWRAFRLKLVKITLVVGGLNAVGLDDEIQVGYMGESMRETRQVPLRSYVSSDQDPLEDVVSERLASAELRLAMQFLIAGLPPEQQKILQLFYGINGEEATVQEILRASGMNLRRLKKNLDAAAEGLREPLRAINSRM